MLSKAARGGYQDPMRRLVPILCLTLAACTSAPRIDWPTDSPPLPPPLLPVEDLAAPDGGTDPGPALAARAAAFRAGLAI